MGRIKNLDEIKAMVRERTGKRNPFRLTKREDVESVLSNLTSKDPELWAREWSHVAKPYEEKGAELEQFGKFQEARDPTSKPMLTTRPADTPRRTPLGKWNAFRRVFGCTRRRANILIRY